MSKHAKRLRRLLSIPTDFTWSELESVMSALGYDLKTTGGSGRKFVKEAAAFVIHEPHPHKLLKAYQLRGILAFLKKEGDLE